MTEWKLAMIILAPFLRGKQMFRTWVAMFGASIAAHYFVDPLSYLAIDAVCAALVVARPAGLPQKAIGALFILMVMFDLGFFLSDRAAWATFASVLTYIGWVQWLILGVWAGHDAWRNYRGWSDGVDRAPTPYERPVR